MSHDYLARKIQITKFEATSYTRGYWDIRADSITGRDLQTQKECLSVWRCSNIREDVAEIALALATTLYDIEGVSIILLNKSDMECLGFKFNDVEGETLVKDLNKRHTDIIELDALKSVRLALGITIGVRDNGCYQFTTAEIKGLLSQAIEKNRLDPLQLSPKIQKKLNLLTATCPKCQGKSQIQCPSCKGEGKISK